MSSRPPSSTERRRDEQAKAQQEQRLADLAPIVLILCTPEGQRLIDHLKDKFRTDGDVFVTGYDTHQAAKQDGRRDVVNYLINTAKTLNHAPATTV